MKQGAIDAQSNYKFASNMKNVQQQNSAPMKKMDQNQFQTP